MPLTSAFDVFVQKPTVAEVVEHHTHCFFCSIAQLQFSSGVWLAPICTVWILYSSDGLCLRVCVIAYNSTAGNEGYESTERALQHFFFGNTFTFTVLSFVSACLRYMYRTDSKRISLQFGQLVHEYEQVIFLALTTGSYFPPTLGI